MKGRVIIIIIINIIIIFFYVTGEIQMSRNLL